MPFLAAGPLVIAHRGGGLEAPENSWTALAHTADLGLAYLETDAHITADGVIVLAHDPVVDRVLDGAGAIADLTWRELSALRDRAGDPPVRLTEALAAYPALRFNIDAKVDAVAGPLARLAAEHPDRMCLASFSDRRLAYIRAVNPHVATSLGRGATARLAALSRLPRPLAARVARADAALSAAVAAQVPVSFRGIRVVTERFVALAHGIGLQVHVWTIDDPGQMRDLLALGVDGIVTDRPRLALQTIGKSPAA